MDIDAIRRLVRSLYRFISPEEIFFATADLLNLEVDLLFFDTTTTYVEREEEDGLRRYGHSKDSRPDLPLLTRNSAHFASIKRFVIV